MTPDQFQAWSTLLSEAVLLISKDGRILAASDSVRQLGVEPRSCEQKFLHDISSTSQQKITEFLQVCSRCRQPMFIALAIRGHAGQEITCRCDGLLIQHESEGEETRLLIKLTPKEATVQQYELINKKISELDQEIKRRIELENKLQDRNEFLNVTLASIAAQKRALELLVSGAPLEDVLDALCEVIEGLSQQRFVATVLLVDEEGQRLRSAAGRRAPESYSQAVDGVAIGPNAGSCGTAAFRGEQVIVSDIDTDPLWAGFRELAQTHGFRACWSNPIFSSQNKVLGTFAVYARVPCQPTSDQLGMIEVLSRTAGIAVERRRDEEALRVADRRKDEFLATLAHELRNPLAPIRTGLEVMKLSHDDPETIEEIRETMERQTQQLITLVDDLLDVSRITRGKFELRKSTVALADVLKSAIEASTPYINEAGHEFTVTIPDSEIYLEADPNRLTQVVSNLLNNAAKYTPDQGKITLDVEVLDDSIVISVADTGIGIPADMQENIFEMFTQIDHLENKAYAGLGIGLTLVKSLVDMHAGKVKVDSEGPNQGSTFRVILPKPGVSHQADSASGTQLAAKAGLRVLIVDDNQAAARLLKIAVSNLGNDVQCAEDGLRAVEVAKAFRPQVILMDLGMPRMDGLEAAQQIRQNSWGKEMILVATTGWGQESDRHRSNKAGFDYHLVKPVASAELEKLFQKFACPQPNLKS